MEKIKKTDKTKLAIILMVVVGLALLVFSEFGEEREKGRAEDTDVSFYTEYLEERIMRLCTAVEGIDRASVFLTLECSSEYVYSEDGASDFLILSGADGEEAVLLQEIYPKVRGVAVVCTGGDLPRVRETLTELLAAALDLPTHRIRIAGG